MRARLGTAAQFCEVVVLKLRTLGYHARNTPYTLEAEPSTLNLQPSTLHKSMSLKYEPSSPGKVNWEAVSRAERTIFASMVVLGQP